MPPAFVADQVVKRFGSNTALGGVSLEVGRGELVGLLGPNGAGKSTLVKIGCGLVRATAGSAHICGHAAGTRAARASVGYLAELFRFPGWLKAHEVLALHQELAASEGGQSERAELLELVGLDNVAARRVDAMSKGMQQRLGIAQALIGSPQLLLLDEPTSALDPAGRRVVRGILEEVRNRGIAVLLNSHLLSEIELVCDRVVILLDGGVIAEGDPKDMVAGTGVQIETDQGMKSWPEATRDDIPGLVAQLIADGMKVYGVRPTQPTLEDVYMEAVRGEMG